MIFLFVFAPASGVITNKEIDEANGRMQALQIDLKRSPIAEIFL
jgi:hypothetical protein